MGHTSQSNKTQNDTSTAHLEIGQNIIAQYNNTIYSSLVIKIETRKRDSIRRMVISFIIFVGIRS